MGGAGVLSRSRVPTRRRSLTRDLSGLLVGGLVALALVLVAGWVYADRTGLPGPGLAVIVGHAVAAVAAVVAQVWVDRRADPTGTVAAVALAVAVVGGLALAWLY